MLRPQKLVYGRDGSHDIAAIDQDARIARKALGVAGDIGNPADLRLGELFDLCLCACSRRIQRDGVERTKLADVERHLEEIAPGYADRLQSRSRLRGDQQG